MIVTSSIQALSAAVTQLQTTIDQLRAALAERERLIQQLPRLSSYACCVMACDRT